MFTNYPLLLSVVFAEIFSFVRGEFTICLIITTVFLLYGVTSLIVSNNLPELADDLCGMTDGEEQRMTETI